MCERIPVVVQRQMNLAIGPELTIRLLRGDFLPVIDWVKFRRVNNGGAPLSLILKALR
jgi:hypothetical protein